MPVTPKAILVSGEEDIAGNRRFPAIRTGKRGA
jgi:hypothetical protein